MKPLTPKQQAFVREYLVDLNATRAARDAGYSKKTAEQQGSRLLRNVQVAKAVSAATQKRAEQLDVTARGVLSDIVRLSELAEKDGKLDTALRGRELLGKHLQLFTDKVKHEGDAGVTVVVQQIGRGGKAK